MSSTWRATPVSTSWRTRASTAASSSSLAWTWTSRRSSRSTRAVRWRTPGRSGRRGTRSAGVSRARSGWGTWSARTSSSRGRRTPTSVRGTCRRPRRSSGPTYRTIRTAASFWSATTDGCASCTR